MSKPTDNYVLPSWMRGWERFWFTPADPSLLGLIRVACGLVTTYILVIYSFSLQDFMGPGSWHDLNLRDDLRYERPISANTHTWKPPPTALPQSEWQRWYLQEYRKKFRVDPPLPYPDDGDMKAVKDLDDFMTFFGLDLRTNGLRPPSNDLELEFAWAYTNRWNGPPPQYPKDRAEAEALFEYIERFGADPRRLYDKGMPIWSIWFHVTDPDSMAIVHGLFVLCAVCLTLGLCTRVSASLTWFACLCYIHRNPTPLFGVDTMMIIVLLYLMISPCGVVFSLDAVIARWWARKKPEVIAWWCRLWNKPAPEHVTPAAAPEPQASVSANIAIRLLQVHVCIIYLMAGLSKLQGQAWWTGGALWLTLGNYEFAPMQYELYLKFLRFLGSEQWLYDGFMTGGGLFTLCFEIGYTFLVWRPRMRWVMLGAAILLHGFIGFFMGLQTFSLMMLVMNMAFLTKDEALWILKWFDWSSVPAPAMAAKSEAASPPPPQKPAAVGATTESARK